MRKMKKNWFRARLRRSVFPCLLVSGLYLLLLFSPLAAGLSVSWASTAIAQNAIVLIIDGLRNDEAFEDSTHQYIPRIWNDLRPQGIIHTNFWNTGVTSTTAGHMQIVTGVRENFAVQSWDSGARSRAKYPNIFEYYRRAQGVSANKVWFIAGKGSITNSVDASLHPDYANWGASIESLAQSDSQTWASVQQKMDTYHPSLMVINLRDVDAYAHTGDYAAYVNAIKAADQIAYELWQKIEGNGYYKDKTDLIVTTDHGRFSDGYFTGFKDHQGRTHGDRHIMFLAMGPDFKRNEIVDVKGDQIDLAPTIGAILGFQTPYADGRVMAELFNDNSLGSHVRTGGQRRISLSACATGLHAVWSQKRGSEWDIWYKRSMDGGVSWTTPIRLFASGVHQYYYEAKVTSQDNGLVYVTATGYTSINEGGPTYTWKVFGIRSLDGGNSWGTIKAIMDVGVLAIHPRIVSRHQNILIAFSALRANATHLFGRSLQSLFSADGGATFTRNRITDTFGPTGIGSLSYLSLAASPEAFHCIWASETMNSGQWYWNTFYDRASGDPIAWGSDTPVFSGTSSMTYFMNNSMAVNDSGQIAMLLTRREDTSAAGSLLPGKWTIMFKSSQDSGSTFTDGDPFYDSSAYEAWNPRISFVSPDSSEFVVVWEQHYDHRGAEIFCRTGSMSDTLSQHNWGNTQTISFLDGKDSAEPDLAVYQDAAFIGWQDYENGYWEIRVKGINWEN